MPKLLNSVSTLDTNLPFWTRLPVPPTQPQFSSVFSLRSLIRPSTPILFSGFPGNWSWMVTAGRSLSAAEPAAAGYHAREFHAQLVGDGLTLPVMKVVIFCHPCTGITHLHHLRCHHRLPKAHKHKPLPEADAMPDRPNIKNTCSNLQRVHLKQKKTCVYSFGHLPYLPRAFPGITIPAAFTHHLPPKGRRTLEFYKTFLQDLACAYREPTSQQWCHWQNLQHTVVGWPAFKNLGKVKVWWVNILGWYLRQMMSNMMLEDKFQWLI